MAEKYFTISYDDGLEQDRKIIYLMEKYGIKGTFNISSGKFGQKGYIKKIGDLGYKDTFEIDGNPRDYRNHFILDKDQALKLYSSPNVEVASHGTHHLHQEKLTEEEVEVEITQDIKDLSEMFGYQVVGHAFPFGSYNDLVLEALKDNGIRYARTAAMFRKPKDFSFDRNQLLLNATCWHMDPFVETLLEQFIATPVGKEDMVFYMWGHGYELDYGSKRGNYEHLEHLFQMVAKAGDVHCVTNRELYE